MSLHVPYEASRFDERRNSSRVFPVAPGALREATRALAQLARDEPALCDWIEDGYPNLTEDEHVARFGKPYGTRR